MSIKHITANAIEYTLQNEDHVLIHVCNNKGVFNAGIAKQIRQKIPKAYTSYKTGGDNLQLGQTYSCLKVINMIAQDGYRGYKGCYAQGKRYLNYTALCACLQKVRIFTEEDETIVVPHGMGAGLAGGDWTIVLELIEWFLKDRNVVVCKLHE